MMCERTNCAQNRSDIARIVVGPGRLNPTVDGESNKNPPTNKAEFIFRRIPTPQCEKQSDIRKFLSPKGQLTNKSHSPTSITRCAAAPSATVTPEKKTPQPPTPQTDAADVAVGILTANSPAAVPGTVPELPETKIAREGKRDDETELSLTCTDERKPAARPTSPPVPPVFVEHVRENQTSYYPVVIEPSDWKNLPRGVYLTNDLSGTDPNRIVLVLGEDAEEVPDFVLDALPMDHQTAGSAVRNNPEHNRE